MKKEIAKTNQVQDIIPVEEIKKYLITFGLSNTLTEQEQNQFIAIAQAFNLNPFKKEIYCVPYGQGDNRKLSIITGYEVYIKRAEETDKLDGWEVFTSGCIKDNNLTATIIIHRKDWSKPFKTSVEFAEYNQNNYIWKKIPKSMLEKVAIARGFRLCFSRDLGKLPYTQEELPDEMAKAEYQTKHKKESVLKKINPEDYVELTLAPDQPDQVDDLNACAEKGFQEVDKMKENVIKEFSAKPYIKDDPRISTILSHLFIDLKNQTKVYNIITSLQTETPIEIKQLALKLYMIYSPVGDYKGPSGTMFKDHLTKHINSIDERVLTAKLDQAYSILQRVVNSE